MVALAQYTACCTYGDTLNLKWLRRRFRWFMCPNQGRNYPDNRAAACEMKSLALLKSGQEFGSLKVQQLALAPMSACYILQPLLNLIDNCGADSPRSNYMVGLCFNAQLDTGPPSLEIHCQLALLSAWNRQTEILFGFQGDRSRIDHKVPRGRQCNIAEITQIFVLLRRSDGLSDSSLSMYIQHDTLHYRCKIDICKTHCQRYIFVDVQCKKKKLKGEVRESLPCR